MELSREKNGKFLLLNKKKRHNMTNTNETPQNLVENSDDLARIRSLDLSTYEGRVKLERILRPYADPQASEDQRYLQDENGTPFFNKRWTSVETFLHCLTAGYIFEKKDFVTDSRLHDDSEKKALDLCSFVGHSHLNSGVIGTIENIRINGINNDQYRDKNFSKDVECLEDVAERLYLLSNSMAKVFGSQFGYKKQSSASERERASKTLTLMQKTAYKHLDVFYEYIGHLFKNTTSTLPFSLSTEQCQQHTEIISKAQEFYKHLFKRVNLESVCDRVSFDKDEVENLSQQSIYHINQISTILDCYITHFRKAKEAQNEPSHC